MGRAAPGILLSLLSSSGVTSVCHHTAFYVGARHRTQVLVLTPQASNRSISLFHIVILKFFY